MTEKPHRRMLALVKASKMSKRSFNYILLLIMSVTIQPYQRARAQASPSEQVRVVLVVDNSGSMKVSDPKNLRFTAVRLFIALLDEGDQVGLISFSTNSQALTQGLVSIHGADDKKTLLGQLQFAPPDGYTDVKAALSAAKDVLNNAPASAAATTVVLLTDGKPEIPQPYLAYEQETLDLAHSLGVPVLTIALTSDAQTSFLSRLAAETGGLVLPADNASDLLDAYLEAFGHIKDRFIMGSGQNTSPEAAPVTIDPALAPYLERVSFVISKPESISAGLINPGGQEVTSQSPNVSFLMADDPRFEVITIEHPVGGDWHFDFDGHGIVQARAILHSRLRTRIIQPAPFHPQGDPMPIVVQLFEEKEDGSLVKIIGDANFSAVVTRPGGTQDSLDRFFDDGTHGDGQAGNGDYTRMYVNTDLTGSYTISVVGQKGDVPVDQSTHVDVVPFPKIVVDAPIGDYKVNERPIALHVHLEGGTPTVLDEGRLIARLTAPSGKIQEINLIDQQSIYTGSFMPLEDGSYKAQFETRGAKYEGVAYQTSASAAFHVQLIPTVSIKPAAVEVPTSCLRSPHGFSLPLTFQADHKGAITFALEDDELSVTPSSSRVEPGDQRVDLTFTPRQGILLPGDHETIMRVDAGQDVEILPSTRVPINYHVPNLWSRCRQPVGWAAFLLLGMGIVTAGMVRLRKTALPPLVTGTLRHWANGAGAGRPADIDLTALAKNRLVIGKAQTCDVVIHVTALENEHAVLSAERTLDGTRVVLDPIGEIRKNYSPVLAAIPLSHGEAFSMAGYTFQYLSDSGE